MITKIITSGVGLGELKFGITMDEAKQFLGVPSSIDKYSYTETEDDLTETWFYKDLGINISFDQENDWRLTLITINSEAYLLERKMFIGQEKRDVLSELEDIKINDLEYEDVSSIENPTHELFSSDSLGINFWFDYDKLTEIQIGLIFIDDETIKWPE